jgi:thiol:disulfide interchange protein
MGWGAQFQRTGFNVFLAAVVFVMALSFLGVWEIPLPGFVGSKEANQLASREGAGGAFFKGVLTTVLATPCSGPFLGPVFGFTVRQSPVITYLIFGCIGLGMASPYLIIGAFPRLIRFLPKPGAWMDTFKQMMAFVLLGTVVFLFTFMNRDYLVPTFALLVGLWAGCWWIGRVPLYEGWNKIARAWVAGSVFAAIVGVASFHYLLPGPALLPWQPYSPATLAKLTSEGKTVMVDFTADWCLTCKLNLKTAINTQEVQQVVQSNGVVPLLADWTNESEEIQKALDALGSNSIPVLAIYPAGKADKPIVLPDLLSRDRVVEALKSAGPSAEKPKSATTAMATP